MGKGLMPESKEKKKRKGHAVKVDRWMTLYYCTHCTGVIYVPSAQVIHTSHAEGHIRATCHSNMCKQRVRTFSPVPKK